VIKPYYTSKLGTLYNCDCLDILPEIEQVDLCLTDPPYGINYQSNRRAERYDKIANDTTIDITDKIIEWCFQSVTGASYVFARWDMIYTIPKPKSLIVWVKNNWTSGDLEHEHARQWEAILFYKGKNHKFLDKRPCDIIYNDKTLNELHPTEKPVNLIKKMLMWHDGLVLDPFLGSGTTAIAAEDLNRRWIGIEKEEKYCELASKRIEQFLSQGKLF